MVIIIDKNTKPAEIENELQRLRREKKKGLISFYGKLKGAFGDGLEYQKSIRG